MRIAYKTREMQTPQGLSRVWFCAHPSDYDKYLEALCSEILSITGCAVWYDSEPSAPYERVELIDTANGKWMSKGEAGWMGLSGSALLTGKK